MQIAINPALKSNKQVNMREGVVLESGAVPDNVPDEFIKSLNLNLNKLRQHSPQSWKTTTSSIEVERAVSFSQVVESLEEVIAVIFKMPKHTSKSALNMSKVLRTHDIRATYRVPEKINTTLLNKGSQEYQNKPYVRFVLSLEHLGGSSEESNSLRFNKHFLKNHALSLIQMVLDVNRFVSESLPQKPTVINIFRMVLNKKNQQVHPLIATLDIQEKQILRTTLNKLQKQLADFEVEHSKDQASVEEFESWVVSTLSSIM